MRLARTVSELPVQVESTPEVILAGFVAVEPQANAGETVVSVGLSGPLAKALCCGKRSALDGVQIMPVPALVEKARECPGDLPGVDAEASVGGVRDRRDQHPVLGLEPG